VVQRLGRVKMNHLGFEYAPYVEHELDSNGRAENKKIYHEIWTPDHGYFFGPWSPYKYATRDEFESVVERFLEEK
jgi:hypothetical protein